MRAPLAQRKAITRLIWCGVFIGFVILVYPYAKRSGPGQVVRAMLTGKPGAQLWADDLADDVRHKRRLGPLQDWSVQTLARYRKGEVRTAGDTVGGGAYAVRLSSEEIPDWLTGAWRGDKPKVSVVLTESNEAESINVAWYLSGLLVGPTNYVTAWQPWYIVQVKPGIYAYSLEK
jgi:hypothetical protein